MLTDIIAFRAAMASTSSNNDAKFEQAVQEAQALRAAARKVRSPR